MRFFPCSFDFPTIPFRLLYRLCLALSLIQSRFIPSKMKQASSTCVTFQLCGFASLCHYSFTFCLILFSLDLLISLNVRLTNASNSIICTKIIKNAQIGNDARQRLKIFTATPFDPNLHYKYIYYSNSSEQDFKTPLTYTDTHKHTYIYTYIYIYYSK